MLLWYSPRLVAQPSSAVGLWQWVVPLYPPLAYLLLFISQSSEVWCLVYCSIHRSQPPGLVNSFTSFSVSICLNEHPREQGRHRSAAPFLKAADFRPVSASLLTILIAVPDILNRDFTLSNTLSTYLFHFLRLLFELLLIALWCAAFVTMLLPKGKDFRLLFHRPPYVEWICAVVLAAIEL